MPRTSEIREVPVFNMRATPIPCKLASGYTSHLVQFVPKNMNGTEAIVVIKSDINIGMKRFLNFYVILACKNTENSKEKIYASKGTEAMAADVPLSDTNPQTEVR